MSCWTHSQYYNNLININCIAHLYIIDSQQMLPADQLRLVVCLVLTVPLAYLMGKLTSATHFITLSILTAILFQYYVFLE